MIWPCLVRSGVAQGAGAGAAGNRLSKAPFHAGRLPADQEPDPGSRDSDFSQFQTLLHRLAGIHLSPAKKAMVSGRLAKRVRHHRLRGYGDHLRLLHSGSEPQEMQIALDPLTTNETYFFREPKHFDFPRTHTSGTTPGKPVSGVRPAPAARNHTVLPCCSPIACARRREIVASDISTRVLRSYAARTMRSSVPSGYPQLSERLLPEGRRSPGRNLPDQPEPAHRIRFLQINLNEQLPQLGDFDVIFLRNVSDLFRSGRRNGSFGDCWRAASRRTPADRPLGKLLSMALSTICR